MNLDDSLFVAFSDDWKPSVYRGGKNNKKPCMRNGKGVPRSMTAAERFQHAPETMTDLNDPLERRQLADLHEDRGNASLASEHRQAARDVEIDRTLASSLRHFHLHVSPPTADVTLVRGIFGSPRRLVRATSLRQAARRQDPSLSDDEFLQAINRLNKTSRLAISTSQDAVGIGRDAVLTKAGLPTATIKMMASDFSDFDPHHDVTQEVTRILMGDPDATPIHQVIMGVRDKFPGQTDLEIRQALDREMLNGMLHRVGRDSDAEAVSLSTLGRSLASRPGT